LSDTIFPLSFETILVVSNHLWNDRFLFKQAYHSPYVDAFDEESRNALDGTLASISAVLDGLADKGVSGCSIQELRRQCDKGEFVYVLKLCEEYAECIGPAEEVDSLQVLLISSWTSLCRYLALHYKHAYKHFHALRMEKVSLEGSRRRSLVGNHHSRGELELALQQQIELGEMCCASQKGLILAQAREKRLSSHPSATAR
jgi:hypothetical protein